MQERLDRQLLFLQEVDQMKQIERRSLIMDGSRRENDAEHSWHLALMAMLLFEYAEEGVDLHRVLKMALIHDLIEIYAGDTFAFDVQGNQTKAAREHEAADKLFEILPKEQGRQLRILWEEFDEMQTPDACYAAAIDRLQPFLSNLATNGHTWVEGNVHISQVLARMDMVRIAVPKLWPFVQSKIDEAVRAGYIRTENTSDCV